MISELIKFCRRTFFYFRRGRFDEEMQEEVRFHLEMKTREKLAEGLSHQEARYAAQREFGNQTLFGERSREMWAFKSFDALIQDLRYGFRMLVKNPLFSAVAILSLALGMGANSTIFSIVDTIILRPLPYREADRLVVVWETHQPRMRNSNRTSMDNFLDWQEQNHVFQEMAQTNPGSPITVIIDDIPERSTCQYAPAELFPVLGVKASVGRTFLPEDIRQNANVVMISYPFWQRRFGGDQNVIGRTLTFNTETDTVIGVLPQGFSIFNDDGEPDVWRPLEITRSPGHNGSRWLNTIARLKSGVSIEQAQAEMNHIAQVLEQQYPDSNKGWGVRIQPLQEGLYGYARTTLYPLFGAVMFVLLIACANVANLLLARTSARQKEVAIRSALGASRSRLVRQFLTESVILALIGGGVGLFLAYFGVRLFISMAPEGFPLLDEIRINGPVLVFTTVVAVLSGIVTALLPAWQCSSTGIGEVLKESSRSSSSNRRHRTRNLLVTAEIALALVLLTGAGLMINSFLRLTNVKTGFDPTNVLTMEASLGGKRYFDNAANGPVVIGEADSFFQEAITRIQSLPRVESAGMISWLPTGPQRGRRMRTFTVAGSRTTSNDRLESGYNAVSAGYFRTMKIPLLKGRDLTDRDTADSPWVVVINETMARRFWPDEDPVGKQLRLDIMPEERPREIIGVVGDVRQAALFINPEPEMYVPFQQQPLLAPGDTYQGRIHMSIVIRTTAQPASLVKDARTALAEIDKNQPIYNVQTMEQATSRSITPQRFYSILLGVFAGLAMVLAAMGIYGVVSYSVVERVHEIGIRMALGAQRNDVLLLVLRQALGLTLIGITAGLIISYLTTNTISRFLYNVNAHDPITYFVVSLALMTVAALAAYHPARKASKVDPMVALRSE